MRRLLVATTLVLAAAGGVAWSQGATMSFFVTSVGSGRGADLGGLQGADAHCASLAEAAGVTGKTWHAYLSTSDTDARDRIGSGPWHNAKGEKIADDVASLHGDANGLTKQTALDCRDYDICCGQIDIGNAATEMTERMAEGMVQADGRTMPEARMSADNVGRAVAYIANLPLDANVLFMTVMANKMPFVGRG